MNIEERIDKLFELRESISALKQEESALQEEYDREEYALIEDMQSAGLSRGGTDRGTVSIKMEKYPQVVDMESFVNWCANNGRPDMIQKRVSTTSFKEYFEQKNEYPDGLDTYDRVKVSLRKR
jgi:hypothetical protein